jgi:CheY-like chemotaxis protein
MNRTWKISWKWQLLRQLLKQAGFQVRVAENGAEGVEIFQSWRPHFIWMDGLEATPAAIETSADLNREALAAFCKHCSHAAALC